MTSIIDLDTLRTALSVDEDEIGGVDLSRVVAREETELVRRCGAHYVAATTVTETHPGRTHSIYLTRPIGSVSSVSEYLYLGDTAPQTLTVNTDYVVWESQGRLERLYGCWGAKVAVTFIPADDLALRKQVLIELVRIALNQSPFKRESVAGVEDSYSYEASQDWQRAREQQYARLLMSPL